MKDELIPVYVLFLSDDKGNFDWVYTAPKPYYETREEADKIRKELIEKEETVTEENSRVERVWRYKVIINVNNERKNESNA